MRLCIPSRAASSPPTAALPDDLYIRIAEPHGVGADEDLIGGGPRHRPVSGPSVLPGILQACAVERPNEHYLRVQWQISKTGLLG